MLSISASSYERQELEKYLQDLEVELLKYQKCQEGQKQITKLKRQKIRIQIILLADEGKSQTEICQELKCSQATARHWISMSKSGDVKQWQENVAGPHQKLTSEHIQYLKYLVVRSPREFGYSLEKWTGSSLGEELRKKFGIPASRHLVNRYLKKIIPLQIKNLSL